MITLIKKELGYYLNNPAGYIIVLLFGAFVNFFYVKDIFVTGSASLQPFFSILPWFFLVFIPALTMRALAEEKRTNTIETLLTLPISETQVVLSKFVSLMILVALSLLLTVSLPLSLSFLTKLYLPEVIVSYCGVYLMAGFFVAISLFFSSLTKNQVIAFLSSVLALFFFIVLASDIMGTVFSKFLQDALSYFSPVYHLQNFIKGVIDVRSLFYFLSFTGVSLFLTILQLERRS